MRLVFLPFFVLLAACVTPLSAEQRGSFETHYTRAIMDAMWVNMCVSRHGDTPASDAAAANARFGQITQQAEALGLSEEIERANEAHARRMATIRIDGSCRNGLAPALETFSNRLELLERDISL